MFFAGVKNAGAQYVVLVFRIGLLSSYGPGYTDVENCHEFRSKQVVLCMLRGIHMLDE